MYHCGMEWSRQPRPRTGRYLKLERIGEMFGVPSRDIPRFIREVEAAMATGYAVEDWHGKTVKTT